jgi:hypothetical protein
MIPRIVNQLVLNLEEYTISIYLSSLPVVSIRGAACCCGRVKRCLQFSSLIPESDDERSVSALLLPCRS